MLRRTLWLFICLLVIRSASAQSNQLVFGDALTNAWQDWSWATVDLASASPTQPTNKCIKVTAGAWAALYLHHAAQDASVFSNLTFSIHGGTSGGQLLLVQAMSNGVGNAIFNLPTLTTNWQQVTIPFASLGLLNQTTFDGFWIQDRTGTAQPLFYVDNISLTAVPVAPVVTNINVAIMVDAARDRHPISDLIYGVAFASNQLADLNAPLNRSGGNAESRYNWQQNAHNRGSDWYFQSIADTTTNAPGKEADDFVANSKASNAQAMMTVSMVGWVAKVGANRSMLASYSISKYGPQTGNDWQWFADSGNGVSVTNNTEITWNDPNDANVPSDSAFQQTWIQHLTNRWGTAANGGVRYYLMDNEPSIWHSTHRDVHPVGATMGEIRDKFFDYAAKVKATDPNALVAGPEEWGWGGYVYSGYDQQWGATHGWANLPDRTTNGGWDYMPWFLDQARQRATNTNQRLLDIFSVHYYPQGGEYSTNVTTAMQLTRNRSTRSLWDTNYVDQTWIGAVVQLVPRLKSWVTNYYPGTKTAITEYNWGAEDHINGATTQADILGIFGREGLDVATRWTTPDATTPTYKAMKLYRNYDGNKSAFGDTSVYTAVPNPDEVAAFGAVRSTNGALTVMIINKHLTAKASTSVTLSNFVSSGVAQLWQLTCSNAIVRLPDVTFSGGVLSNSFPSQSVTLVVIPQATAPRFRSSGVGTNGAADFWVDAQAGLRCVLQSSSNLINWSPIATNTFASNSVHYVFPRTNAAASFYRSILMP